MLLVDDVTRLMLHFDEPSTVNPVDASGTVADLTGDATSTPTRLLPTVAAGFDAGNARQFGSGVCVGVETASGALALLRDVTVEALITLDHALQSDGTRTIAARGDVRGSAPCWCLQVTTSGAPSSPVLTLELAWKDSGGTLRTVGVALPSPSAGKWFQVAAARRWTSASDVDVDFFCDGALIGTVNSTHGDVGGSAAGPVVVGARAAFSSIAYANFWADAIDELRVSSVARTAEEIRQAYLLLFVRPAEIYQELVQLLPPGESYSRDPSSAIQRELMNEAAIAAIAAGFVDELADDYLPDRATRTLGRWERVTGCPPLPGDSIATRRARVLGFLRKFQGYSRDQIVEALAPTLATDPGNLVIVERSNRVALGFVSSSFGKDWIAPSVAPPGWVIGLPGLSLGYSNGASDVRWTAQARTAARIRTTVREQKAMEVIAQVSAVSIADSGGFVGIHVRAAGPEDVHLFGFYNDSGTVKLAEKTIIGMVETLTKYGAAPAAPVYLRMVEDGAGGMSLSYGSGWDGPWTAVATSRPSVPTMVWAGIFAAAGAAPSTGAGSIAVQEFRIWCPNWRGVYQWAVYRDPALAGTPDLRGAGLQVDKMKPAHTEGRVVLSDNGKCDDANTLADRDLFGV